MFHRHIHCPCAVVTSFFDVVDSRRLKMALLFYSELGCTWDHFINSIEHGVFEKLTVTQLVVYCPPLTDPDAP
jgi:hypothetical protein